MINSEATISPKTFVHSGNVGDLVWHMPTMQVLAKKASVLYLRTDVRVSYSPGTYHPCGRVQMNHDFANSIKSLLETQPFFETIEITPNPPRVDYDIDLFRRAGFRTDRGDIARWPCLVYPVSPNLHDPWISLDAPTNDFILINRTHRYRNPRISYTFLQQYLNARFVGVQREYDDFRPTCNIPFLPTANFLEFAKVIKGCKLFIGNQSAGFAIADALKVPRIVEISPQCPNVFPHGLNGYEGWQQAAIEYIVGQFS